MQIRPRAQLYLAAVMAVFQAVGLATLGSQPAHSAGARSGHEVLHQQFIDPPWSAPDLTHPRARLEALGPPITLPAPPRAPVPTTLPAPTTTSTTAAPTTTTTIARRTPVQRSAAASSTSSASWSPSAGCMEDRIMSRPEAHRCWDDLVARYSWPVSTMEAILYCESQGNPYASNSSGAHGLMQDMDGPFDPQENMYVAWQKWRDRGTEPWVSSEGCWG